MNQALGKEMDVLASKNLLVEDNIMAKFSLSLSLIISLAFSLLYPRLQHTTKTTVSTHRIMFLEFGYDKNWEPFLYRFYASLLQCLHLVLVNRKCSLSDHVS